MAVQTLYGQGLSNPIIKDNGITDDDYEIVRLTENAIVGDLVKYSITAATPTTHRDVAIAAAVTADNQVANQLQGWAGQIIEPVLVPNPVSGVSWNASIALLSGTLVRILKRGARATTAMIAVDTAGHDHLIGQFMCLATAGVCKPVINTYADTTPLTPELAAIQIQMTSELIGRMSETSIDNNDESVVFIDWGIY